MTNLTLMVKAKVTSFKHTHLKSEAKIPYGSKVVVFTRNYTTGEPWEFYLQTCFKANLTLKVKVKFNCFRCKGTIPNSSIYV